VFTYASEVLPMLIKAPEAAKLLDIRLARLYELTRQRIVPAVRIGPKQIRYDPDTLREWIQKGGLNQGVDQRVGS
jgi:predicted DNA-binding transcriptional regulator AlpA